jgi:hypothetical protein
MRQKSNSTPGSSCLLYSCFQITLKPAKLFASATIIRSKTPRPNSEV